MIASHQYDDQCFGGRVPNFNNQIIVKLHKRRYPSCQLRLGKLIIMGWAKHPRRLGEKEVGQMGG